MGERYDVALEGQGYLIRLGSYRRWQDGAAGESQRWIQEDWRGGCGWPVRSKPNRWYRGAGVDVSTEGRLALGWGWNEPVAVESAGPLVAMTDFGSYLYGIADGEGKVRRYQPAGWFEQYALPSGTCKSLGMAFGELMAGSSDGTIHSFDPYVNQWGLRYTRAAGRPITALSGCAVYDGTIHCSVPRLAVGLSRATNGGAAVVEVLSSDGALEQSLECGEPVVSAMCEYRGSLFIATRWADVGVGGRLLAWDGNSASRWGELTEVERFTDGHPVSMAVADGLLWIGMSSGRILACDGNRTVSAMDLVGLGYGPVPVRGLVEFGGRIYAGFGGGDLGGCILRRIASAESGASSGVNGAAEGWSVLSYTGVGSDAVTAMAVHEGAVQVGLSSSTGPVSRRVNLGGYMTAGEVVLGPCDGEGAGVEKALRRLKVGTEPMPSGCEVEVYWSAASGKGPWTYLGHHAYAGQTYVDMYFERYSWTRRLWLKLALKGNGIATPEVRWVEIEYGEAGGEMHWEFEARCEGNPSLPLLLKDNSREASAGEMLAASLWEARGAEVLDFEDVDGVRYTVRVESVTESLAGLPQEYGRQSIVKVRLVKCQ